MSSRCVLCDRSFGSDEVLHQHKRDSATHAFDCTTCDRHYTSDKALQQHLRDSPVHALSFDCDDCDRSFDSEEALQQHLRDSPTHGPSFVCETCDRAFGSEEALEQHLRDSPVHASSFDCDDCDRSFDSEEALQQHLRDSPAHAPSFTCDRAFGSEEALEQHLQDSPAHAPYCETCDRPFGSEEALEQHLRLAIACSKIFQDSETLLDVFFRSFPKFDYDPSLPPATSYANLREHEGWRRGSAASNDAWSGYQDALERYGAEDDLTAWHALCRAISVEPLPQTCEQCEEAVRRTHVNIVDLIEWGRRRGNTEERVQQFTGKVFRNTLDQEDGNVVLRHLLRKIF
ncbi:hypothetical protein V8E54_000003 [Elaphomyces granulatus]